MNRMIYLIIAFSLLVFATSAAGQVCEDRLIVPLVAGQHDQIGFVEFCFKADDTLTVKYNVTVPFGCLTEAHIYVSDMPPEKGAPGQFPYGPGEMSSCEPNVEVVIDISNMGSPLYLAAHSVSMGNCDQLGLDCSSLSAIAPTCLIEQVDDTTAHPNNYIDVWTSGGAPVIPDTPPYPDGPYAGWCVDSDRGINIMQAYDSLVYPSCDPAMLAGIVEFPENLDLVNWLINQNKVGSPSSSCVGDYTFRDVQKAIWQLLDDNMPSGSSTSENQQCKIDELVDMAQASGEDYVPECGNPLAIILVPIDDDLVDGICDSMDIAAQANVIVIPAPCNLECDEETAWALFRWDNEYSPDSERFKNKNGKFIGWEDYYSYTPPIN